ncbi:glycosyltransferase family 2 protein [Arthrobacter sp. FW305-BF8]|uniref:glycosyltransferase family 2 protein n=1 Tax=Arthrobacter sp. FW305-BF8 TaxID=2879617 RepID=UPI001F1BF5D3|nr:glycosyltransferase family 2 protein [Arthrobacter sp. FW305-BF8]UKA55689.1 glycosyltransferase family 2 protein [Arthrobacter sp. FW305-BF8]
MVAHNGSDYLPRTLSALAAQTRPADTVIGVDTGSQDNSAAHLQRAIGDANVITVNGGKAGMGAAVRAGLAALAPWSLKGTRDRSEWIWLLHDDAAPAPEALAELLHAVERAPSVTVAGCKQLDWNARRRLIDVGLSTSRWAERLTLIEADELDQGQYDGRSDTFAVNSAGMLVRRDIWEHLKGFDPALPGTGDDVDFCWRNRLAGHRVVVVPSARMFHVSQRPHALGTASAARRAQVHLRLKHAPLWALPLHAVGALFGSLLRLIFSIAVKDPGYGFSQLLATAAALARPAALARGRRNAARTRRVRRSVVKALQTERREVWGHRRSLMEALGADDARASEDSNDPLEEQPSGDSTDDFAALSTNERGWVGNGAVAAVILATVASFAGLAALFQADAAAGGALLPVSARLEDIWHHASTWWIGLGAGLPGHGDPFGYVLWILGLLGGGNANGAVIWLLLLAMPLSGLAAWFASGALTSYRRFRLAAALVWAAAPALQVAVNQGRVGALLVHVMMPLLVLALLRATGSALGRGRFAPVPAGSLADQPPAKPGVNGTPSWTAAAAAGLALAVITAAAPSLLLPAAVVIIALSLLLGKRGRTLWWALLPSAALFVPFALSTLDRPRALLADPGLPLPFEAAAVWQQILGQPLGFDPAGGLSGLALFSGGSVPWALLLALLIGAPLLALAVAALFVPLRIHPDRRGRVARALWVAALVVLAGGWLAGHVATAAGPQALVVPFTGPAVSAAVFGLLGAAIIGGDGLLALAGSRSDNLSRSGGARSAAVARGAAALALVLLLAGPLAGLAAWAVQNVVQPADAAMHADTADLGVPRLVGPTDPRMLPATAVDRGEGPEQTRTLLISTGEDGTYSASLMHGGGTTLDSLSTIAAARDILGNPGHESVRDDDEVTAALRTSVATLVAARGVDPRPELERLGVGFVVLGAADTAAQLTASRMDAVPGLTAVGPTDSGWLWRVTPLNDAVLQPADVAHRVRIVDGKGATIGLVRSDLTGAQASVPKGPEGRLLVLAERADPGWTAWLDGRKLTSTTSGWSQAFTLPPQAGQVTVRYESPWALWSGILQAAVIGLTVLLALPMPARRPNTGLSRDEGSLRKEYQNA